MRRLALAAGALALCGLAGALAIVRFEQGLEPLDMARAGSRSTVALDREGRLLRAFTMADGRWRLPVSVDEVDPRFFRLLEAAEDRAFAIITESIGARSRGRRCNGPRRAASCRAVRR